MRPSSFLLSGLFLMACSVELAGSAPDDVLVPDGGGAWLDGGGPSSTERCDGIAEGAVQTRVRFLQSQVVSPATCQSETQRRSCAGGLFSAWSGTFAAETCELAPFNSCGSIRHGEQETRTRYPIAVARDALDCSGELQGRTCNDGSFGPWSGNATHDSCVVGFLGGCDLLSNTVPCAQGTSCMIRSLLSAVCVGNVGHDCTANSDCLTGTCTAGKCGLKSAPGQACDEQSDCGSAQLCLGVSSPTLSCMEGTCRCSDGATCTRNDQCVGTCVANRCVPANTTCDQNDDCRDGYQCLTPSGRPQGCYLPDGATCASNTACLDVCRDGVCAPHGMLAEACDENADCSAGLTCRDGLCNTPGTLTEPCDLGDTADCQAGLACGPLTAGPLPYDACLYGPGSTCTPATAQYCASGVCESMGMGPMASSKCK